MESERKRRKRRRVDKWIKKIIIKAGKEKIRNHKKQEEK